MTLKKMINEIVNKPKRYTSATGIQATQKSKTQRITRASRMDLVKSKDLDTLKGQMDASFKMILAAADNTTIEAYVIGRLNMVAKQINARIDAEKKKQTK